MTTILLLGCSSPSVRTLPTGPQAASEELPVSVREIEEHVADLRQALDRGVVARTQIPASSTVEHQLERQQVYRIEPVESMSVARSPSIQVTPLPPERPAPPPLLDQVKAVPGGGIVEAEPLTRSLAPNDHSDRQPRVSKMNEFVQQSDEPSLVKALAAATLLAAEAGRTLDPDLLEPLTDKERQLIQRYHQLVVKLRQELATGGANPDADELTAALNDLLGSRPIQIRRLELCKNVAGFGVFDTIDHDVLLVGRDHKMIVYVELEHCRALKNSGDRFEVKLAQEVVLYTDDAHGLAVWRQPQVQIVDQSRNRRRDFFVVQVIRLPGRLNVGKYRLKVTVDDVHGNTRAEMSLPIQIVAEDPKNL